MRGDRTPESQRDDTGARDTAAPPYSPPPLPPSPAPRASTNPTPRADDPPLMDLGGASTPTVATPTSAHAPLSAPRTAFSPAYATPAGGAGDYASASASASVADDNLQMLAATLRSELDEHRRALDAKFVEALDTVRELAVAQARDLVAEEVARLAGDGGVPAPANEPALDEARIVALADERALHVIASQVVPRVGESLRKLDARLTTAETAVANANANANANALARGNGDAKTEGRDRSLSVLSAEMESVERRVAAAEEAAREAREKNAALEAEMEKLRAIVREDAEKAAEKIFAERVSGSPRASETSIARLRAELNELRDTVSESVAASRGPSLPTLAPTLEATVASLEATVAEMESRVAESEASASAETSASRSDASEWTAKIADASKRAERAESAANAALETFSARLESASATFSTDVAELSTRVDALRTRSEQMESREAERAVELEALRETVEERPANEQPADTSAEAKATAEEAKATAEEAKATAEEAKAKAEEAEAKAEEARAEAEEAKAKAEEAKADAEAEAEATAEETRSKASASEAEASAATAVSSLSVRVDALAEAVGDELLPQMRRFDERVAAVEAKEKTSPTSPTSNSDASTTSIAEKALLEATRAGNIADAALKRVNLDTRGIESLGDRVSRVERRVADAASDVDALRDDVEKGDAALANVLRSEMESAREDTRELEATARRTAEEVRHLSARGFGGGGIGIGDAGDAGTAEEDARGSFRLRSLFRRRVEETDARSPGNATRATEETPRRRDAR